MKPINWPSILMLIALLIIWSTDNFAQKNIKIYEEKAGKYPPCEPSIAINPKDNREMIAGAVLDHLFASTTTGSEWDSYILKSPLGVYGDPCIVADTKGRFYYFHLSNPSGEGWSNPDMLDQIVCHKRSRRNRWNKGVGIGLNPPKDQDKEWACWDPVNKRLVLTWTQFDTYGSEDPACESNIMLSTSKNGKRWKDPKVISTIPGNCLDKSGTAEGAVPTVDMQGNILVSWGLDGNIYFQKLTGDKKEVIQPERPIVEGGANWAFTVPGLGRANGMPVTLCDRSRGKYRGTIYINWADQRNGEDDTDVWLIKSTDGGETWSDRIRVNDDAPGSHQFFTWMAVDQTNGYLYGVFYDRRNHDDDSTDVYLAVSKDGGDTFENRKISASPFMPSEEVFFGDYNNIAVVDGVVRPVWTRYENGKTSIWTALIYE